MTKISITAFYQ